ncbi:hypothetical protein D3C85_1568270 [compost metagenome]
MTFERFLELFLLEPLRRSNIVAKRAALFENIDHKTHLRTQETLDPAMPAYSAWLVHTWLL